MEKAILPFERYAEFEGRSTRTEYFAFTALTLIVNMVLLALLAMSAVANGGGIGGFGYMALGLLGLFNIFCFVPAIALVVRRFHDQGRTGWMALLMFVPSVGGLILFVFMCLRGDAGANMYGEDPR